MTQPPDTIRAEVRQITELLRVPTTANLDGAVARLRLLETCLRTLTSQLDGLGSAPAGFGEWLRTQVAVMQDLLGKAGAYFVQMKREQNAKYGTYALDGSVQTLNQSSRPVMSL